MMTPYTVYATLEVEPLDTETLIESVRQAIEAGTNGLVRHITLTARGGNQPIAVRIRPMQRDQSPCWSGF